MKRKSVSIAPRFGFLYRIGRCPKCMRESFVFAVASVSLLAGTLMAERFTGFAPGFLPIWKPVALTLACVSIGLWVLHVGVSAWRVAKRPGAGEPMAVMDGRRQILLRFLRGVGAAALTTALPTAALAWNECPGRLSCGYSDCASRNGSDVYCCPKGYPILSLCDCRCYQSIQGMNCNSTGSCFDQNF